MLLSCNSSNENNIDINQQTNNIESRNFHQAIIADTLEIDSDEGRLSNKDLAKFAQSLGDARIVGLGEQTHGTGSVFTLKTQLIKYLHEHHDFDVFILESGMFDVNQIWQQAQQGKRIKDIAPDNIFYMYARTAEVTPLFDYINEQAKSDDPLIFLGFDSQHTGGISNQGLVDALTYAIEKSSGGLSQFSHWPLFAEQIQQVLNVNTARYSAEVERLFFLNLDQLQNIFKTENPLNVANSGFWHRITSGLEAQAKRQWQIADNRSKEMGENIKYWAEQYPDKKIVVWAHTWHLTRDGDYQTNAGQVVANAYAEQYFMAHFTSATGEYLDFVTMENKTITSIDEKSVERVWYKNISTDTAFLNLRTLSQNGKRALSGKTKVFANDYQQTLPASEWTTFFDGIFFIKKAESANFQ